MSVVDIKCIMQFHFYMVVNKTFTTVNPHNSLTHFLLSATLLSQNFLFPDLLVVLLFHRSSSGNDCCTGPLSYFWWKFCRKAAIAFAAVFRKCYPVVAMQWAEPGTDAASELTTQVLWLQL